VSDVVAHPTNGPRRVRENGATEQRRRNRATLSATPDHHKRGSDGSRSCRTASPNSKVAIIHRIPHEHLQYSSTRSGLLALLCSFATGRVEAPRAPVCARPRVMGAFCRVLRTRSVLSVGGGGGTRASRPLLLVRVGASVRCIVFLRRRRPPPAGRIHCILLRAARECPNRTSDTQSQQGTMCG
jgi:hypothetical protein